jgi:predicted ester cyclase
LGDLPATGKTGTVKVFTVFRLVNGKIAEEWEIMDELGLMMQLGYDLVYF